MNFIKLLHFTSIVILACPVSWAYDSASVKREDFMKKLPIRVLCVPEASGGVKKDKTGTWESTRFRINDADKFTAKIGKPSDFSGEENEKCEYEARNLVSTAQPVICINKKYFVADQEEVNDSFFSTCQISYTNPLTLKCGDNLILEPNGPYLSATFNVGLSLGEASIQKGTCTTIN